MFVKTYGSALVGIHAISITVEVSIEIGVNFFLVGLADSAIKESQQRIVAALSYSGYRWPNKKVIINMAPASVRKEGASYDLTIAIGILAANEKIQTDLITDYIIMGELSLDGEVKPIKGALPIAIEARRKGFKGMIIPRANAREAAIVNDIKVFGVNSLKEVIDFLNGEIQLEETSLDTRSEFRDQLEDYEFDFADVKGQHNIKRALEIAAAGGHNVILIGPPGAGKTMLAKRIPSILPALTLNEALETTQIHSVAGKLSSKSSLVSVRPFRSPHHTISDAGLVGGGSFPYPGEISLAHNGVLFLDELPEFKRSVLEVLRQPLEERRISIARAKLSVDYPASFMLIASMNPCPCGYYNHPNHECICKPNNIQQYIGKISGPLMDRIDLHVEVVPVPINDLTQLKNGESSHLIRERVIEARLIQQNRFLKFTGVYCNAQMSSKVLRQFCPLDKESTAIMKKAMEKLNLSARAYDRIIKVARTIADLEKAPAITATHMAEAIHYRSLDREGWGLR